MVLVVVVVAVVSAGGGEVVATTYGRAVWCRATPDDNTIKLFTCLIGSYCYTTEMKDSFGEERDRVQQQTLRVCSKPALLLLLPHI